MSENSTPEERTEMPTEKRMGQLRRDGLIHLSQDVVQWFSLTSAFLVLAFMSQRLFQHMQELIRHSYKQIATNQIFNYAYVQNEALAILKLFAPDLLIISGAIAIVSLLAVMIQTQWNVKEKKIHFRFDQLNPITGIKRIVSINSFIQTLKAFVKLAIILPIAYSALKEAAPDMRGMVHLQIPQVLVFTGQVMFKIFWQVMLVLAVLAIFDWFWSKFQWLKNNKMTKAEVKDERKAVEGDEETKRRIQAKGLQRIIQRIKQTVPQADVIVTNPTHFAVAIKYDKEKMNAPMIVAKGADHLAARIREIAQEAGIPILERKILARALYFSTEVGSEIPRDLFRAVAEVLAYIYKLKGRAQSYVRGGVN
jgi:flagellar biosynthetic protein FlhB